MSKTKQKTNGGLLAQNKRATFDYEVLESFEAGIALSGAETKSAKAGHVQLKGAFVSFDERGVVLKGAYIAPYKPANLSDDYDPNRVRRLLLHKREVKRLIGKKQEAGLTIIPRRVYLRGSRVKVDIALARGKKKYEKRDAIKKRELDREMRSHLRVT